MFLRKGMSTVSEALLAVGIIAVSVLFVIVASNIVGFQTGEAISKTQSNVAEDIYLIIENMKTFKNTVAYTYEPSISVYTLTVANNTFIRSKLPNENIESSAPSDLDVYIVGEKIENEEKICIIKQGERVIIQCGPC